MKQGIIAVCLVLLGACAAFGQEAAPAPAGIENLFVEIGGGSMLPHGEDSSWLAYGSANYGLPLIDTIGVGAQVGGKIGMRDDEPDWLVSAGLFQRDLAIGNATVAWAVQGIYQNTWLTADLVSVKPTLGVEIDPDNSLAVTGIIGLNDENVLYGGVPVVQQPIDQAMLVWGAEWAGNIRTELGAGYAFQDIDSIMVAVHGGYMLNDCMNINVTAAFDMDDSYYAAAALGIDLGSTGRNATFNNISRKGKSDYTPFPLGSLPVVFDEIEPCFQEEVCPPPPPPE